MLITRSTMRAGEWRRWTVSSDANAYLLVLPTYNEPGQVEGKELQLIMYNCLTASFSMDPPSHHVNINHTTQCYLSPRDQARTYDRGWQLDIQWITHWMLTNTQTGNSFELLSTWDLCESVLGQPLCGNWGTTWEQLRATSLLADPYQPIHNKYNEKHRYKSIQTHS